MDRLDLRSDTVTWPTAAMRQAMANAPVGDDVYGEDPTVNELESLAAEMLGHEAGLFVSSGTQGNLIAMLTHCQRGEEAIMGEDAHTYLWEAGGMAVLGGIVPKTLPTDSHGRLSLPQILSQINPLDNHKPRTKLICVENSSGGNNGAAIPLDYFLALRELADTHHLRLHLDGARLFNATTALGIPAADIGRVVDSASICLSKGLCAPVGSVLVGGRAFIAEARRNRKLLGGGMRQAGVLAAAGLLALREMTQRLAEDHATAKQLAKGLATMPHIEINPDVVETNMVFFALHDDAPLTATQLIAQLKAEHNIWLGGYGGRKLRAVTHYWVQPADVVRCLQAIKDVMNH